MPESDRKLRVFLCHSSNDKPTVRELYHRLEAEGWIDAWLDSEKLYPGQDWNFEIEKAVEESDVILVCLTKNSVNKEGYVQRELRIVLDLADYKPEGTLFVIPVRLEACDPPRRLRAWQYADFFPEKNRDYAYQRLLVSLRMRATHVGVRSVTQIEKQTIGKPEEVGNKEAEERERKDRNNLKKEDVEKQVLRSSVVDDKALVNKSTDWQLPDITNILDSGTKTLHPSINEEFFQLRAKLIQDTLASLDAPVRVVEINRGPTITQFGVEPLFVETRSGRTKVRVSKIASLADDLASALAAPRVRIQALVPGHSYVGIEVPNDEMTLVALRDLLESDAFQKNKTPLRFALGKDVTGHPISTSLENMPHLLIAGTTGSGKSVCVNAILTCFLMYNTPDDLRMILVDPKRVELTGYNGVPHLLSPVVVEIDRAIGALRWMTRDMDKRYHMFAQVGSHNITDYNAKMKLKGGKKLPFLVIVIDELADLMMFAPGETEQTITRLAQLARATGIHMILATQRPSVDVVTGLIKANFPARIAFSVVSNTDSRVILDQPGAERLLGRGDMLFQAPDAPAPARLQGGFVSENEIRKLVNFWQSQVGDTLSYSAMSQTADHPTSSMPLKNMLMFDDMTPEEGNVDPLLAEAIDLVRREGRASVSMIQRRMRIGYTRAARIVGIMEDKGIVGPPEGTSQMRKILDYDSMTPSKDTDV